MDRNLHLTREGLQGLSKRRLCKLLVLQHMRDERKQVQAIQKMVQGHRQRKVSLGEKYPEPDGVCSNFQEMVNLPVTELEGMLNRLCVTLGQCHQMWDFFQKYQNTTWVEFTTKVNSYYRLRELNHLLSTEGESSELSGGNSKNRV